MKIVYTPRDNPEAVEEFEVDLTDLWVGEVKLLEKVMKETIVEFGDAMEAGSFTHMMALMWIYRRRTNRELRIDDIDDTIRMSELEPVFSSEELDAREKADADARKSAGGGAPKGERSTPKRKASPASSRKPNRS